MLGAENGAEGIFLEKTNTFSKITAYDAAKSEIITQYSASIYTRSFTDINTTNAGVEAIYGNYQSWLDTFNDQAAIGATSATHEVRGTAFANQSDFRTFKLATTYQSLLTTTNAYSAVYAYGGASTIRSSLYSDGSSTAITSEYSSSIKSRMGANATFSDFYATSTTNNISITAGANSILTLQNIAYGTAGPASKSITLSIADIIPTTAIVKLREFTICVNGENKKCMILASDFYT
jgi:hypothetical protein